MNCDHLSRAVVAELQQDDLPSPQIIEKSPAEIEAARSLIQLGLNGSTDSVAQNNEPSPRPLARKIMRRKESRNKNRSSSQSSSRAVTPDPGNKRFNPRREGLAVMYHCLLKLYNTSSDGVISWNELRNIYRKEVNRHLNSEELNLICGTANRTKHELLHSKLAFLIEPVDTKGLFVRLAHNEDGTPVPLPSPLASDDDSSSTRQSLSRLTSLDDEDKLSMEDKRKEIMEKLMREGLLNADGRAVVSEYDVEEKETEAQIPEEPKTEDGPLNEAQKSEDNTTAKIDSHTSEHNSHQDRSLNREKSEDVLPPPPQIVIDTVETVPNDFFPDVPSPETEEATTREHSVSSDNENVVFIRHDSIEEQVPSESISIYDNELDHEDSQDLSSDLSSAYVESDLNADQKSVEAHEQDDQLETEVPFTHMETLAAPEGKVEEREHSEIQEAITSVEITEFDGDHIHEVDNSEVKLDIVIDTSTSDSENSIPVKMDDKPSQSLESSILEFEIPSEANEYHKKEQWNEDKKRQVSVEMPVPPPSPATPAIVENTKRLDQELKIESVVPEVEDNHNKKEIISTIEAVDDDNEQTDEDSLKNIAVTSDNYEADSEESAHYDEKHVHFATVLEDVIDLKDSVNSTPKISLEENSPVNVDEHHKNFTIQHVSSTDVLPKTEDTSIIEASPKIDELLKTEESQKDEETPTESNLSPSSTSNDVIPERESLNKAKGDTDINVVTVHVNLSQPEIVEKTKETRKLPSVGDFERTEPKETVMTTTTTTKTTYEVHQEVHTESYEIIDIIGESPPPQSLSKVPVPSRRTVSEKSETTIISTDDEAPVPIPRKVKKTVTLEVELNALDEEYKEAFHMLESNSQVSCSKNVPKTNKVADVAVASLGPTQELEERHFTIDPPLPKKKSKKGHWLGCLTCGFFRK